MRWLQVTDLESNVHLGLREGDKVRILPRAPRRGRDRARPASRPSRPIASTPSPGSSPRSTRASSTASSWADLVGERLRASPDRPARLRPRSGAPGVTYKRSADFREEGSGIYDKVYSADRPELFFKSTASRCAGPGQPIGRRRDSTFTATEPELAIVIGRGGAILGYTLANDVSAWDIERENPLYLPQSKVYNGCFAFGPVIVTPDEIKDPYALELTCRVDRGGREVFSGIRQHGPAQAPVPGDRGLAAPVERRSRRAPSSRPAPASSSPWTSASRRATSSPSPARRSASCATPSRSSRGPMKAAGPTLESVLDSQDETLYRVTSAQPGPPRKPAPHRGPTSSTVPAATSSGWSQNVGHGLDARRPAPPGGARARARSAASATPTARRSPSASTRATGRSASSCRRRRRRSAPWAAFPSPPSAPIPATDARRGRPACSTASPTATTPPSCCAVSSARCPRARR